MTKEYRYKSYILLSSNSGAKSAYNINLYPLESSRIPFWEKHTSVFRFNNWLLVQYFRTGEIMTLIPNIQQPTTLPLLTLFLSLVCAGCAEGYTTSDALGE